MRTWVKELYHRQVETGTLIPENSLEVSSFEEEEREKVRLGIT